MKTNKIKFDCFGFAGGALFGCTISAATLSEAAKEFEAKAKKMNFRVLSVELSK